MPLHLKSLPLSATRFSIPCELTNEESLLLFLGLTQEELKKIWWFRERMYHNFSIPRRNGKLRLINAPDKRLKYFQKKIALLLVPFYRVRHPVHGFVNDKSVKTNATAHLNSKFLLNIDLKDFFPSIKESRVKGLFQSLGIDDRVSEILARICCNEFSLPQGAPTSPIISNMICFKMDKDLLRTAKAAHCIYTRYADDISFSSYRPLTELLDQTVSTAGKLSAKQLSENLNNIIRDNGFQINENKIYYADNHSRRVVTGIKTNEGLNVERKYIRNLRAVLHSIEKFGIDEAEKKYREHYNGTSSLESFLRGKLSWLRNIKGASDPVFRRNAERFNRLFLNKPIKITPIQKEVWDRSVWVIEDDSDTLNSEKISQGTAFFMKDYGLITAAHCANDI